MYETYGLKSVVYVVISSSTINYISIIDIL